jgi:hypothetical protein
VYYLCLARITQTIHRRNDIHCIAKALHQSLGVKYALTAYITGSFRPIHPKENTSGSDTKGGPQRHSVLAGANVTLLVFVSIEVLVGVYLVLVRIWHDKRQMSTLNVLAHHPQGGFIRNADAGFVKGRVLRVYFAESAFFIWK